MTPDQERQLNPTPSELLAAMTSGGWNCLIIHARSGRLSFRLISRWGSSIERDRWSEVLQALGLFTPPPSANPS